MKQLDSQIVNWPNFVSAIRILMAPVIMVLALNHQTYWFFIAILFTGFTDVLDGFLARWLNQVTALGSRLDSWGDFIVYSTLAVAAWLMWPEIVKSEWLSAAIIVISFTLPVLVGLIKFHAIVSYHTWSVKLAVLLTFMGYILLFAGFSNWMFRLAAVVCLYAAIEEISISLILKQQQHDVKNVWQAIKYNKGKP
ncbi:MAG: CDP-alcohol phosphatidyltransferase family protein [Gammaproteobacteria bacterium]